MTLTAGIILTAEGYGVYFIGPTLSSVKSSSEARKRSTQFSNPTSGNPLPSNQLWIFWILDKYPGKSQRRAIINAYKSAFKSLCTLTKISFFYVRFRSPEKQWEKQFSIFLNQVVSKIEGDETVPVLESRVNLLRADPTSFEKVVENASLFIDIDWSAPRSLSILDLMITVTQSSERMQLEYYPDFRGVFVPAAEFLGHSIRNPSPDEIATCLKSSNDSSSSNKAETLLRTSFTQFHNQHNDNMSAFLGENSSVKDAIAFGRGNFTLSPELLGRKDPEEDSESDLKQTRSCLQRLPTQDPILQLTEAFVLIPQNSWMLPFIIANTKTALISTALVSALQKADVGYSIQYNSIVETDGSASAWSCIGTVLVSRDPLGSDWESRK